MAHRFSAALAQKRASAHREAVTGIWTSGKQATCAASWMMANPLSTTPFNCGVSVVVHSCRMLRSSFNSLKAPPLNSTPPSDRTHYKTDGFALSRMSARNRNVAPASDLLAQEIRPAEAGVIPDEHNVQGGRLRRTGWASIQEGRQTPAAMGALNGRE